MGNYRSNVGTPSFYIPWMDWKKSMGMVGSDTSRDSDLNLLNPSKLHRYSVLASTVFEKEWNFTMYQDLATNEDDNDNLVEAAGLYGEDGYAYVFVLGHNLASIGAQLNIKLESDDVEVTGDVEMFSSYTGNNRTTQNN